MTQKNIAHVPGFKAAGVACGLKQSGNKDLALIVSERPASWAALFTANAFQAAPVLYDKNLLVRTQGEGLQAVVINAGNANACTGKQGERDAAEMARRTEAALNLPENSVAVMSTGVIGHPMPMEKIRAGIDNAAQTVSTTGGHDAAQAIMTTDTMPKSVFRALEIEGKTITLAGIAKGSGMIHPNMATMLAVLVTDAVISPEDLDGVFRPVVKQTFNRISVDGDTSTNDTVLIMANGASRGKALNGPALAQFAQLLHEVCVELAKMIARDGEGATKLVEVRVEGAASQEQAALAAGTIATSPLSKTALFGNDPNWGRFLAAVGRSGAAVEPEKTALWLETPQARVQLVAQGQPIPFDASALSQALQQSTDIGIIVNLGLGEAEATYWTCDFSYKYVEINAEYHT